MAEIDLDTLHDETSVSSSVDSVKKKERSLFHEQMMRFLCSVYGQFIIVIFVSTEIALSLYETDNSHFEFLYTYIYLVSIIFFSCVFVCVENEKQSSSEERKYKIIPKFNILHRVMAEEQHGSTFFLSGIFLFGIATMVYSGIQVAKNLQLLLLDDPCEGTVVHSVINPILNLIYTFMQMYFIFTNAGLNFTTRKTLMRFGLTHIISTNICVFMSALLYETIHTIDAVSKYNNHEHTNLDSIESHEQGHDNITACQETYLLKIEKKLSHYLLPCVIEFGILSMYVLLSMRKHIGVEPKNPDHVHRKGFNKMNTIGAKKGLFFGLILFVMALINIIILLMSGVKYSGYAIEIPQIILLLLCIISTFVGFFKIQKLQIVNKGKSEEVEGNLMLRVALCGSYMLAALMVIASFLSVSGVYMVLASMVGILSIVQLTQQIFFMYDITCRRLLPPTDHTSVSHPQPSNLLPCLCLLCHCPRNYK